MTRRGGNKIEKTAVVCGDVQMGRGNYVGHFAVLIGPLKIGDNNRFFSHVVIGTPAQHSQVSQDSLDRYNSEKEIVIGDRNIIREFTSIHKPMQGTTRVHDDCFFLAHTHLSHDVEVFDRVTMANNCQLGGNVCVMEGATLGQGVTVHQRSTIGAHAMVGMGAVVVKDILPFSKVVGNPARFVGVNEVGMQRARFSQADMLAARMGCRCWPRLSTTGGADLEGWYWQRHPRIHKAFMEFAERRDASRKVAVSAGVA